MYSYLIDQSGNILAEQIGRPREGWFQSETQIDATKFYVLNGVATEKPPELPPEPTESTEENDIQIKNQIITLEQTGMRAYREIQVYGTDSTSQQIVAFARQKLADIESQIIALRAQLTTQ